MDDELKFAVKDHNPYSDLQTKVVIPTNVPPEKRKDIKTLKKALTIHFRQGEDVLSSDDSSDDFCADSDRQDMHSAEIKPSNATVDFGRDPDTVYNQPSPLQLRTPQRTLSPEKIQARKKEQAYLKDKINLNEIFTEEQFNSLLD